MKAIRSLKLKNIRILQADKGNCTVVLDQYEWRYVLLESGVYVTLSKDPTPEVERKVQKLLSKYEAFFHKDLKYKLTLYYNKPAHLCGLPKICELDILLWQIVSSIDSQFLYKITNSPSW